MRKNRKITNSRHESILDNFIRIMSQIKRLEINQKIYTSVIQTVRSEHTIKSLSYRYRLSAKSIMSVSLTGNLSRHCFLFPSRTSLNSSIFNCFIVCMKEDEKKHSTLCISSKITQLVKWYFITIIIYSRSKRYWNRRKATRKYRNSSTDPFW